MAGSDHTTSTAQPLRFKDSVYGGDRIATAEIWLLRVLLGGKAIVTVRELSELTITDAGGLAGLELSGGRMGLSVARQLMAPGEAVQIHRPNAVASVRGSVVIAEVSGGQRAGAVSLFNVLSGPVDIVAGGTSINVGSRQRVRVSGGTLGPVEDLSDEDVSRLAADLKGAEPQHREAANEFQDDLTVRERNRALTYAPGSLEEQLAIGVEPPESLILPPAAGKTAPKPPSCLWTARPCRRRFPLRKAFLPETGPPRPENSFRGT